MNAKHQSAAKSTITRDVNKLDKEIGNVYETVVVLSKRANQIAVTIKEELGAKLEEFASNGENLEEVYENREQIEISKHYERMPKPAAMAIQELIEGRIQFRRAEDEPAAPAAPAAPATV
ncbi:MAG: DNA-directed RNA polymerase subunit omega [Flavobacteriales bacterium]|nr:DNA-directed RNA polymerase subunit omega [Flavobacteriales bacterium]MBK9537637.1 DNA-directed RNA polymerase subunit omega [Flavobacteriales bacterium]MBP6391682.1 DNA-directed RNA polymerase subunit omega [Flavobacteriales bacterium]MBP6697759.1 DNA-directed RNA polymerase subunit omega [Flavobacteriales bacterium]